ELDVGNSVIPVGRVEHGDDRFDDSGSICLAEGKRGGKMLAEDVAGTGTAHGGERDDVVAEPCATHTGRVQIMEAVGSGHQPDVVVFLEAIHLRKQCCRHFVVHLVQPATVAFAEVCVHFVKKN